MGKTAVVLMIMQLVEAIILGVTQGVTEFLPVSSSGHLFLARQVLGIDDVDGTAFDAFLHLGTLLAVIIYYWKVWVGMGRGLVLTDEEGVDKRNLAAKLAVATVPAAIAGYGAQSYVDGWLRSDWIVAGGLVLTALALLVDGWGPKVRKERVSFKDALIIGLVQVMALVPGVSRSGVTMAAGRGRGLGRKQAVTFSFLMSAPIIAGAGLASLSGLLAGHAFSGEVLVAGFLTAFVSGLVAITGLMKVVEKISLVPFAIYLVAAAVVMLYAG